MTRLLGSLACHVLGWCRDWLEAVDNAREWDGYEPDGWLGEQEGPL